MTDQSLLNFNPVSANSLNRWIKSLKELFGKKSRQPKEFTFSTSECLERSNEHFMSKKIMLDIGQQQFPTQDNRYEQAINIASRNGIPM